MKTKRFDLLCGLLEIVRNDSKMYAHCWLTGNSHVRIIDNHGEMLKQLEMHCKDIRMSKSHDHYLRPSPKKFIVFRNITYIKADDDFICNFDENSSIGTRRHMDFSQFARKLKVPRLNNIKHLTINQRCHIYGVISGITNLNTIDADEHVVFKLNGCFHRFVHMCVAHTLADLLGQLEIGKEIHLFGQVKEVEGNAVIFVTNPDDISFGDELMFEADFLRRKSVPVTYSQAQIDAAKEKQRLLEYF
uniref:Uncharacterized protein n=1 Tax=Panagrolaimus sp. JU765 TaxID=591449 RepID=A0AC34QJT3_9BILA